MLDGYETPDCAFYIGERCLYDSVIFNMPAPPQYLPMIFQWCIVSELFIFLYRIFPGAYQSNISLPSCKKGKVLMQRLAANKQKYKSAMAG